MAWVKLLNLPVIVCRERSYSLGSRIVEIPNLDLPTAEPSTPNWSKTLASGNLPTGSGDSVVSERYKAMINVVLYNSTSSTLIGYVRVRVDGVDVTGVREFTAGATSYFNCYLTTTVSSNSTIAVYAWAAAAGGKLYLCAVQVFPWPRVSNVFNELLGIQVSSYTLPEAMSCTANRTVPAGIGCAHADVIEASTSSAGFIKISRVAKPTVNVSDTPPTWSGYGALSYYITVLYPSRIVWAEYV